MAAQDLYQRRFLTNTLDSLSAHIAILDETGKIIAVNESWRRFANANGGNHVVEGANYLDACDRVVGSDAAFSAQAARGIRAVMAGENCFFYLEYPCHSPSEHRWFAMRVTPFLGGESARVVVAHENITQRKEAEAALARANKALEAAQARAHLGSWELNPVTNTGSWSKQMYVLFDRDPSLGAPTFDEFLDLVHPDDRELLRSQCARAEEILANQPLNLDFRGNPARFGERRHFQSTMEYLRDDRDQASLLAGTTIDITERKRAEALIIDKQERLRSILNTVTDGIITIDEHGIMQTANSATEHLFGYTAAEMIGQNVSMLMPSPYREEHDGYIARYLRTGETHIIGIGREVVARRKDGTIFPVELAVSQIEHLRLFTGIVRNITKRKELEQEIVEIATLEQRRIGQDLHDECGQELTALGLLADSLIENLGKTAPESVEIARKVEQGVQRVLRQVRNISRGLAQAQLEPAGLPAALVELTGRLSETSGVHCFFHGDEVVPIEDTLKATHLFHIAQEACTNALKHAQATTIEVRLCSSDGVVLLQIQDDGIGIPQDAREGLGRRIMRNRASVIGARLTIEPAQPRGTLVTCTLGKEHSDARK
jgi:PAS domain S-box-containing protein